MTKLLSRVSMAIWLRGLAVAMALAGVAQLGLLWQHQQAIKAEVAGSSNAACEPEVKDLAERLHAFLNAEVVNAKRTLPILLQPGEAVFFHDERVIHGRNSFDAKERNDRFFWKTGFRFKL